MSAIRFKMKSSPFRAGKGYVGWELNETLERRRPAGFLWCVAEAIPDAKLQDLKESPDLWHISDIQTTTLA